MQSVCSCCQAAFSFLVSCIEERCYRQVCTSCSHSNKCMGCAKPLSVDLNDSAKCCLLAVIDALEDELKDAYTELDKQADELVLLRQDAI